MTFSHLMNFGSRVAGQTGTFGERFLSSQSVCEISEHLELLR